jgi:hypothetical protein
MSFRDTKQQSQACYLLLDSIGLRRFWNKGGGPTGEAAELLGDIKDGNPCLLSSGEILILRVAFDFWNKTGKAEIGDLYDILDEKSCALVVELIFARSRDHKAVDTWLAKWGQVLHPVDIPHSA